jgi:aminotransferase
MEGEGTFYLFVSIEESALGSEAFCDRLLDERGVSAVPGIGYGDSCDGYIRLSVGSEDMERIRGGLGEIAALVRETSAVPALVAA